METYRQSPGHGSRPILYACPSCRLHLLSWTPHLAMVEMFHKVAMWSDFWTGDVRLVCQYCLGATAILPPQLVELLGRKYALHPAVSSQPVARRV